MSVSPSHADCAAGGLQGRTGVVQTVSSASAFSAESTWKNILNNAQNAEENFSNKCSYVERTSGGIYKITPKGEKLSEIF